MCITSTTKIKFPDNFHKDVERLIATKDSITLMKQMQNINSNNFSKFLIKDSNSNEVTNRLKNNNKNSIIPSGKNKFSKLDCPSLRRKDSLGKSNSTRNRKTSKEIEDYTNLDESDCCTNKGALKKECITDSSQYTTNTTTTNLNNYYSQPNNNNLEVIIELETQRTNTINETDKKSSLKTLNTNLNLNYCSENLNITYNNEMNLINPQYSWDYMMDIYDSLLEEERNMTSLYGYMIKQIDINEKMRAILIDWIIDVHLKFKLTTETLFLGVYLIDRYLTEVVVKRDNLQLIGVSALLIACKYEEIFSPELRDFEYITDKTYTKEQITEIEIKMLKLLQFNITVPSSFRFYEIITNKIKFSQEEISFGKYLLELFLIDYRYTKYVPSQIALSVCFLVINLFSPEKNYAMFLCLREFLELECTQDIYFTSYENILKECCKDICFILDNIENTHMLTVKKKYMTAEHYQVSRFVRKLRVN